MIQQGVMEGDEYYPNKEHRFQVKPVGVFSRLQQCGDTAKRKSYVTCPA
jgi:hypothetical protein